MHNRELSSSLRNNYPRELKYPKDKYLYKASFQTVVKLVSYFEVEYSLFKE